MPSDKPKQEKHELHPRNKNRNLYDLPALITVLPELSAYVKPNKFKDDSIDFTNPVGVKLLNRAILKYYYNIAYWEFPNSNLCPPIPGRADYIHYIADLLIESNSGKLPDGNSITCLDVGIGASCIYPIIGVTEYGWNFIGADISAESTTSSQNIANKNPQLAGKIDCRLQTDSSRFFIGILQPDEKVDITVCNPPFHASAAEAQKGTRRKVQNLSGKKVKAAMLNFSGISNELIYEGGEITFINNMAIESKTVSKNCYWFTTLVSKEANLKGIYNTLKELKATTIKTIPMGTGNKSARVVAWTFLSAKEQKNWKTTRWAAIN